jgi:hypothetical protein
LLQICFADGQKKPRHDTQQDADNENLYKSMILPVVLYGCETWSLTLKEGVWEQGSEENTLVEPKRAELTMGCEKFYSEKLRLHSR